MLLCIHTKKLHMNEKIPLYVFIAYFGHFRPGNFHFALCAFVLHSIDIVLRLPIVFEKHNKLLNMHIQYRTNAILNISPFFYSFIHCSLYWSIQCPLDIGGVQNSPCLVRRVSQSNVANKSIPLILMVSFLPYRIHCLFCNFFPPILFHSKFVFDFSNSKHD